MHRLNYLDQVEIMVLAQEICLSKFWLSVDTQVITTSSLDPQIIRFKQRIKVSSNTLTQRIRTIPMLNIRETLRICIADNQTPKVKTSQLVYLRLYRETCQKAE